MRKERLSGRHNKSSMSFRSLEHYIVLLHAGPGFCFLQLAYPHFSLAQSENEELRSENKRLENDKMMEQKDHDTERTLLKSHISNLEKQLKDREMVLRDCQESKEAELQEAKLKLQGMKAEDEAKLNKEREDSRQKLEEMKVKYDEKIREFKEEINVKQTVHALITLESLQIT